MASLGTDGTSPVSSPIQVGSCAPYSKVTEFALSEAVAFHSLSDHRRTTSSSLGLTQMHGVIR